MSYNKLKKNKYVNTLQNISKNKSFNILSSSYIDLFNKINNKHIRGGNPKNNPKNNSKKNSKTNSKTNILNIIDNITQIDDSYKNLQEDFKKYKLDTHSGGDNIAEKILTDFNQEISNNNYKLHQLTDSFISHIQQIANSSGATQSFKNNLPIFRSFDEKFKNITALLNKLQNNKKNDYIKVITKVLETKVGIRTGASNEMKDLYQQTINNLLQQLKIQQSQQQIIPGQFVYPRAGPTGGGPGDASVYITNYINTLFDTLENAINTNIELSDLCNININKNIEELKELFMSTNQKKI